MTSLKRWAAATGIFFGTVLAIQVAWAAVHYVGMAGNGRTSSVSAVIRTPDWTPQIASGSYLYDWVMVHDSGAAPNPWIIQVGWIMGAQPTVASYAYVGGPGGWTAYVAHPEIPLALGSDHRYEVTYRAANWWDVKVDGRVIDTFNVPSGPTGWPQVAMETNDDNARIPDLRNANISVGPTCQPLAMDPGWSEPAYTPCSLFYARH